MKSFREFIGESIAAPLKPENTKLASEEPEPQTIRYENICGSQLTIQVTSSEAYNEFYYENFEVRPHKLVFDKASGIWKTNWEAYGFKAAPTGINLIEFRAKHKCSGYYSIYSRQGMFQWFKNISIDWDTVVDWLAVGLEWVNPAVAAFVDVAHCISYVWRAEKEFRKNTDDAKSQGYKYLAAAVITGAFAAVAGPMQAYAPVIKGFFTTGGVISSGVSGFAKFLIANLSTILRGITQTIQQLNASGWANYVAKSIGVTVDFIAGVPQKLEDTAVSMLDKLEKNTI